MAAANRDGGKGTLPSNFIAGALPEIVAEITTDGDDRSARGIAAVIGRMISAGSLTDGTRLPTVRDLARRLGVSPTTVSDAWRSLADVGAIETRGRNGTLVRQPKGPGQPRRYRRVTEGPGHFELDLSSGTPDPALLPDLGPIIARMSRQSLTSSYLDHPVLPELEAVLTERWPFPPEAMTVVDGAMDALDRVAQYVLRLGDRVAVEHPTFPPMLDLLEQLGCEVIAIDVDADGLTVEGLREAVRRRPRALFLQPRAHNPTGVAVSLLRAEALAEVLRGTDVIIVEDDHSNEISAAPLVSLGRWLPMQTIHIRSFSKSHGPDLRLAAVGGAGDIVSAIANRRLLGPGWSSRILQSVLLELLRDPATGDSLAHARASYAARRSVVSQVLTDGGVSHPDGDGINLWMRVADERRALLRLAACGIGVAPGGPFMVRPDGDHVRVTVGLVNESDAERVGELLVDASGRLASSSSGR
ncbi:MAG TPA: aminotransferase class I/II-fold pyridoxal phosphate-dependent enzyme [Ilumatobacteraceae bacterium]|nr:aminotransferase class I/II-fold pyridoxal phosphate-dependent enzyme [Ilumatobacteraceae bacterium]